MSDKQYEFRIVVNPPDEPGFSTEWTPMTAAELASVDELLLSATDSERSFRMEIAGGTQVYLPTRVLQRSILYLERRERQAEPDAPRKAFQG